MDNEYPKWRIHLETGAEIIVRDAVEHAALGTGWGGQAERLKFLAGGPPEQGVIVNLPKVEERRVLGKRKGG